MIKEPIIRPFIVCTLLFLLQLLPLERGHVRTAEKTQQRTGNPILVCAAL